MKYVISYDLNSPGKDYAGLTAELQRIDGTRVLYSQWVVDRTGTTPAALRDHFVLFMDRNDRLLVTELTGTGWAGRNLMVDPSRL